VRHAVGCPHGLSLRLGLPRERGIAVHPWRAPPHSDALLPFARWRWGDRAVQGRGHIASVPLLLVHVLLLLLLLVLLVVV